MYAMGTMQLNEKQLCGLQGSLEFHILMLECDFKSR